MHLLLVLSCLENWKVFFAPVFTLSWLCVGERSPAWRWETCIHTTRHDGREKERESGGNAKPVFNDGLAGK